MCPSEQIIHRHFFNMLPVHVMFCGLFVLDCTAILFDLKAYVKGCRMMTSISRCPSSFEQFDVGLNPRSLNADALTNHALIGVFFILIITPFETK